MAHYLCGICKFDDLWSSMSILHMIKSLEGTKYTPWDGKGWGDNQPPFYCSADNVTEDVLRNVRENGVCCAGLVNLVCRLLKAPIPLCPDGIYSGGMYEWTLQRKWNPYIDEKTVIPDFSLVMVPYNSPLEQDGHIGIYLGDGLVAHSTDAHGVHIIELRGYPWLYYCPPIDYLTP